MRKLNEIIDELWSEDLKVNLPNDKILEIAIQIQRNEILEEAFTSGSLNDLSASIENLIGEISELNQYIKKLTKNTKD